MSTSLIRVLACAVAIAIFAFPAVSALPDPAPVPVGAAPAPSGEAPVLAPSADKPTPGSVTESLMATPEADAPAPPAETLPIFKAEQLDQLLAPVALYPDALLAQILMAATYPLEVVKADRWLQDSIHANLQGDQLATAIEAEAWDPSQVAGAFSSDPADDGWRARLDGTAGPRRHGTAVRRHGFDPTSSPSSRGGGDALVELGAAGNHRTPRRCD